ncbi:hypothetical protein NAT47_09100 [Flavobacterium sp. HXWNR69]|uniref:Trimeric autotransporter adhesin YadA-like head domain-containing protein n=1 Tax=Flavobacterium fragile TaxID=2949085 RepID=A0ABT0THW7_9FLAO|nr:hypothetical protein [Flavobacterium sp. HXWNR69]MCL9770575.1 hypothetical protein [Flavobacterium sp. HXWNR69]
MKKILLFFTFLVTSFVFSQTSGITYQAVIYKPNGDALPGVNNNNVPLALKNICIQFTIVDFTNTTEYKENITTTTDKYGMVNLIIGTGNQVGGYASSFTNIDWNTTSKSLIVGLDVSGMCNDFVEISNAPFSVVPFAYNSFNATNASNITGIVPITNGGTNATTVQDAKTNLGLDQVNNTSDINKPISTATQNALALKENSSNKSTDATLADGTNTKFPTELAVKTYVNNQITTVNTNTNTAITNLQNTITANQTATDNALALKENSSNKSTDATLADGTNTKFPTELAVKTYVNNQITTVNTNTNTAITNLQNTVTANQTATDNALALKENSSNKSTDATLADGTNTKFPTELAVKTYVNNQITTVNTNTNTAITNLQNTVTANQTATDNALALKENSSNKSTDATLADATNTKFPTELAVKTFVNNQITTVNTNTNTAITNLQNTITANQTATDNALALKENSSNKSTDATLADGTNTKFPTELAVKTYVDSQILSAGNNFLPLTGGTLTGQLTTPSVVFNDGSTWQIGNSGQNFSIYQGGCCSRVIIDNNGNFGIGGNYVPQFKLDIEGDGRFTSSLTANSFSIPNGLSSQFLKADGSLDTNNYFIADGTNVAIGYVSGSGGQGDHSIAIGSNTAQGPQAEGGVAVGYAAAQYNQGLNAVAIGSFAGNNNQPENAVAVGFNAQANGINAIAIGANATAQNNNTVQLGDANITNVNTYGSITANAEISPEITTNFTINAANAEMYKGKVLICNPNSQITITFENNLPLGFNCMVLQKSDDANKINFAGGAGVVMKNRNNFTATAGNYAIATIVNIGGGIIVTAGDMQ